MADSTPNISSRKDNPAGGGVDDHIEVIGRYTLYMKIGTGGMAAVHLGWISGAADFSRVVAIKRMHPRFAAEEQFASRFRDEAHLSSRLLHPNIVQVLDVVEHDQELLIVMEYIHGVSVAALLRDVQATGGRIPPNIVAGILIPALQGLHGAHEATDDDGYPLGVVHRDFSPQNIMVSTQGHAKVLDFGIAKARTQLHVTSSGAVSGKFGYLAPEQALADTVDRRTDVFSAGIVLWEMLTGTRLFGTPEGTEAATLHRVLNHPIRPPSETNPAVSNQLDRVVLQALERSPGRRTPTAQAFAQAIESAIDVANPSLVAEWVGKMCTGRLDLLARKLHRTRRCMSRQLTGDPVSSPSLPGMVVEATPVSERATVVVPQPNPPASRRRRGVKLLVVGGTLGIIALGVWLWPQLFGSTVTTLPPPPRPLVPSAPSTPTILPTPPTPVEVPDMAEAEPTAAEAEPTTAARAAKTRPNAKSPRARLPTAKSPTSPRPNCDPPTYLDADGIRIFKEECL